MKAAKFFYLLAAAAVLAAAAWHVRQRGADSWQERALPPGTALLGDFPVNDVAVVRLKGPEGAVTLRRGEHGWGVAERAGYPSNFEKISSLVKALAALKAVQSVPVADADLGALQLREPAEGVPPGEAGVAADLEDASGKVLASAVLGKIHHTAPAGLPPEIGGTATGRYVLPGKQAGNACLTAETFADLHTAPAAWVDQAFVHPGMSRRIEVQAPGKDRAWILERKDQGSPWQLAVLHKGQTLDGTKVLNLDSLLNGMAVADAADGPGDARAKPLEEAPVVIIVDSFDGVRYRFLTGEVGGANLPVRIGAEALPAEAGETEAQGQARGEKIREAARFAGKTVFIPRNFFEPFLAARPSLIMPLPAVKAPEPAGSRKKNTPPNR